MKTGIVCSVCVKLREIARDNDFQTTTTSLVLRTVCNMQKKSTTENNQRRPRRWASMQEAAEYLGVSSRTVREWITRGQITGYRINARVYRVDLDEVDAAMRPFGGAA